MLCHPWRQRMPCYIWNQSSVQWTVGRMNGSLSFPTVSAEESSAHLCASKLSTGPSIFVFILGMAPGQPPEFSINLPLILWRGRKKPTRLLLGLSLSWVMNDHSVGLCVDDSRAVLAQLNLTLHQPSLPCLTLHPFYQILQGHKYNSDQHAETICFSAVSVFWQMSLFTHSSTRSCTISRAQS